MVRSGMIPVFRRAARKPRGSVLMQLRGADIADRDTCVETQRAENLKENI